MGWDFYTFEKQPPYFIEEILIFMLQEANKKESESKKAKSSMKGTGYSRG